MAKASGPLDRLEAQIRAGELRRCAWELLRLQIYPGLEHAAAARKLLAWAKKKRIMASFESTTVYAGSMKLDVIYVEFALP